MTITAKFPGTCTACGGKIRAGDSIEWKKGEGSRHTKCPTSSAKSAPKAASKPRAPRAPSFPESAPVPGAQRIEGRRDGRGDVRLAKGGVRYLSKVGGGGGPDGHYFTVLVSRLYPPFEDNQQFSWHEAAWVRPATDEEAAPLAAKRAAEDARVAKLAELASIVRTDANRIPEEQAGTAPAGRELTISAGTHGSGVELYRLTDDGRVARWHSGFYDDYRRSMWISSDARAVTILTELLGGAS